MWWGLSLQFWQGVFFWATVTAATAGAVSISAAFVSAIVGNRITDFVQGEADKKIAEASARGEEARTDAAKANQGAALANERAAGLERDAANARLEQEKLKADNLALQTVLLPRHVGAIGIDEPPKAQQWFASFDAFAGTKILIQVVPGDPEAQNLANEIAFVLSRFGWHPEMIGEQRSGISLNLQEGLHVFSPGSYKAWDPNNVEQQRFSVLGDAARSLAVALTKAGLGIGSYPVSGTHGLIFVVDFPEGSDGAKSQPGKFDPPLDGVYLQVGSRPIASTVQWIKAGRPDASGNPTMK